MNTRTFYLAFPLALTVALLLLASGCGGGRPAAVQNNGPAANSAVGKGAKKDHPTGGPVKLVRSVFNIDQNSRDPFNPQNKRKSGPGTTGEPQVVADVPALLNEAFQGIGGSGDDRIAMINNILLERGKTAAIPVRVGVQTRMIKVRCREIASNQVVLDVEGYGQIIVKHKENLRAAL